MEKSQNLRNANEEFENGGGDWPNNNLMDFNNYNIIFYSYRFRDRGAGVAQWVLLLHMNWMTEGFEFKSR
jgi:hypothetical protein